MGTSIRWSFAFCWHKWTFDFDAVDGLRVLHNDKELTAIDSGKTGLEGFRAVAVWGDAGAGEGQSIWIDDLSVTLGGPVEVIPEPGEADPYDAKALDADPTIHRPVVIWSRDNRPSTPKLEDLPACESVSQYGITWTFERPACVGQFVNGDWYVVGPATVRQIDPRPLYGGEIPKRQWGHDAFFDYVDRWMYENDAAFVQTIKEATGHDHDKDWARQGQAWDAFVNEMWAKHRPTLPAPTDGWKQPHDDAYYRAAIQSGK